MTEEIMKKLSEHDKRFDAHDKRFDKLEVQVDFIATEVVEQRSRLDGIDNKLENMATKDDLREIANTLDHVVKLVEKKDQETTMLAHGFVRHGAEIDRIKTAIGFA